MPQNVPANLLRLTKRAFLLFRWLTTEAGGRYDPNRPVIFNLIMATEVDKKTRCGFLE